MEDWNPGMMGLLVRLSAGSLAGRFFGKKGILSVFIKMTFSASKPRYSIIPPFHHSTIPSFHVAVKKNCVKGNNIINCRNSETQNYGGKNAPENSDCIGWV
ncbi:MAG: hypothetical protein R6W88_02300 [Desulfobacterales bacterium]